MKKIIKSLSLSLLLILISILVGCIGNFEDCKFELRENTISPQLDLDTEKLNKLKNIEDSNASQRLIYDKLLKKYRLVEKK